MHAGAKRRTKRQAPDTAPSALAINIHDLRKQRGMTQKQLAEALGVTVTHVNRIEGGAYAPSADLVPALMRVLDVSADDLFRDPRSTSADEQATVSLIQTIRGLDPGQRDTLAMHADIYRLKRKMKVLFAPIPADDAD